MGSSSIKISCVFKIRIHNICKSSPILGWRWPTWCCRWPKWCFMNSLFLLHWFRKKILNFLAWEIDKSKKPVNLGLQLSVFPHMAHTICAMYSYIQNQNQYSRIQYREMYGSQLYSQLFSSRGFLSMWTVLFLLLIFAVLVAGVQRSLALHAWLWYKSISNEIILPPQLIVEIDKLDKRVEGSTQTKRSNMLTEQTVNLCYFIALKESLY